MLAKIIGTWWLVGIACAGIAMLSIGGWYKSHYPRFRDRIKHSRGRGYFITGIILIATSIGMIIYQYI